MTAMSDVRSSPRSGGSRWRGMEHREGTAEHRGLRGESGLRWLLDFKTAAAHETGRTLDRGRTSQRIFSTGEIFETGFLAGKIGVYGLPLGPFGAASLRRWHVICPSRRGSDEWAIHRREQVLRRRLIFLSLLADWSRTYAESVVDWFGGMSSTSLALARFSDRLPRGRRDGGCWRRIFRRHGHGR